MKEKGMSPGIPFLMQWAAGPTCGRLLTGRMGTHADGDGFFNELEKMVRKCSEIRSCCESDVLVN